MSFGDFDLQTLQAKFGLKVKSGQLFNNVPPVEPATVVRDYLRRYSPIGVVITSEKGRSELFVSPILAEVWAWCQQKIGYFSGVPLDVDPNLGLTGTCDFVFTQSEQSIYLTAPLLVVVEAKRGSIADGQGQCAAEMLAAQRFNIKAGKPIDPIHGCITTGTAWQFLRLTGTLLEIDADEYSIREPDRLLGIFLHCLGFHPNEGISP